MYLGAGDTFAVKAILLNPMHACSINLLELTKPLIL
jgi:hypothetical protein